MPRLFRTAALVTAILGLAAGVRARESDAGTAFRVFLNDGRTLAVYGQSAVVGDRLVFMLPIGDMTAHLELQLMSLPLALVDLARTTRYAESVRAAYYAATRGEADYAEITGEVSHALDQLSSIPDPKKRLAVAEDARQRLIAWSNANYSYRAADVQELAGLFDEVIAELRVAAGESKFSVALVAGPVAAQFETLQPPPSLRDSIAMALSAADATDNREERVAILRTALSVAGDAPVAPGENDLRTDISRRLDLEVTADCAYALLSSSLLARADDAMRRGDVRAVDALKAEVADRDDALGERRPDEVKTLLGQIDQKLELARAHRLALDHYAMVRPSLLGYERKMRPTLAAFDGMKAALDAIRDMSGPAFDVLLRTDARLKRIQADLEAVHAPDDLLGVHATFVARHPHGRAGVCATASSDHRAEHGGGARRIGGGRWSGPADGAGTRQPRRATLSAEDPVTPSRPIQRRRLVRTRDLSGFRQALVEFALGADGPSDDDPLAVRRHVMILPTRASIELLRQTIERTAAATAARPSSFRTS